MKALSQSVAELTKELSGLGLDGKEIDKRAIAYLKRTGTPYPSAGMVMSLADCVRTMLEEEEEDASRCEKCGYVTPGPELDDYRECKSCRDNRNERAEQASLSDYYGSSTPQTLDEQHMAAWLQKGGR